MVNIKERLESAKLLKDSRQLADLDLLGLQGVSWKASLDCGLYNDFEVIVKYSYTAQVSQKIPKRLFQS